MKPDEQQRREVISPGYVIIERPMEGAYTTITRPGEALGVGQ
jgi:hypothetical protein